MRLLKALVTGHNTWGIKLDNFLYDIKFPIDQLIKSPTDYMIQYVIETPSSIRRIIHATCNTLTVVVKYHNGELSTFDILNNYGTETVLTVNYNCQTFACPIQEGDDLPYMFRFSDFNDKDFIFNFDIQYGTGTDIKEIKDEIDWFYDTYKTNDYRYSSL